MILIEVISKVTALFTDEHCWICVGCSDRLEYGIIEVKKRTKKN